MKLSALICSLLFLLFPLFGFKSDHKYYISVTQVEHVSKEKSLQIISRIFIDDMERVLRMRYDENIILGKRLESPNSDFYIKKYLQEKLKISIDGKEKTIAFVGKEYDDHMIKCYLEIEKIKKIKTFKIENKLLFDVFSEQQNIIKTNINSKKKSFTLTEQQNSKVISYE